jgi:YVTN family beta-propeller protein
MRATSRHTVAGLAALVGFGVGLLGWVPATHAQQDDPCLEVVASMELYPAGPMDAVGGTLFAALPDDDVLAAIDAATGQVVDQVAVGTFPVGVAIADGKAYVANATTNDVSVVDLSTFTVSTTIGGFNSPNGPAVANGKVYVANVVGGGVGVIDPTTDTLVDTIGSAGGNGVYNVAGEIWLMSTEVIVIDPVTDTISTNIAVGSLPIGVEALDGRAYVTNAIAGSVSVIDVATHTVIGAEIPVDGNPRDAITYLGFIYVSSADEGTVQAIDPGTLEVTTVLDVGDDADRMQVVGGRLFIGGFPVSVFAEGCAGPVTTATTDTSATTGTPGHGSPAVTPRFAG